MTGADYVAARRFTVADISVGYGDARIHQLPHICFTAPMTRIARIVVPGLPHHVT